MQGRGREGVVLTLCLRIYILWSMGNPMPHNFIAGFNSHHRTKNLGSGDKITVSWLRGGEGRGRRGKETHF